MALNIRNEEAEALAAEVARRTGETETEAVINALKERLTSIVLEARYGAEALRLFDLFRERAGLDVVEVDEHQARQGPASL